MRLELARRPADALATAEPELVGASEKRGVRGRRTTGGDGLNEGECGNLAGHSYCVHHKMIMNESVHLLTTKQ